MEEYTIEPFKNYMGKTMYKLVEIKENGEIRLHSTSRFKI